MLNEQGFLNALVMVHRYPPKEKTVNGSTWYPPHVSGSTANLEEVGLRGPESPGIAQGDLKSQDGNGNSMHVKTNMV